MAKAFTNVSSGFNLENGTLDSEEITKAFIRSNADIQDSDETNELMETLQLITEMSSQDAMDSLLEAAYARSLVRNYRGFSFYWGVHGYKRSFPTISDETITALQAELDDWFASNNRLRNCRVYIFPQGHRVSIVIKYGKPLKREL